MINNVLQMMGMYYDNDKDTHREFCKTAIEYNK